MPAIRPFKLPCCFFIKLALLFTAPLSAQQLLTDSGLYQASAEKFLETYQMNMGPDSRLYNGTEYLRSGQGVKGHAFFLSDSLLPGQIMYDGAIFSKIQLQYDLVLDDIVINDYTRSSYIRLLKEKLTSFSILQHNFLFLDPGKKNFTSMKAGFYEQLLGTDDDSISLYSRHEKKITFPANAEEQAKYTQSDYYFLKLDHEFYQVESLRSLLKILKGKKDLLKKYISENKLDFNKDFERSLIKATGYYAQIRS